MNRFGRRIVITTLSMFCIVILGGLCILSLAEEADPVFKFLNIQGENVNVRADSDVKSPVLKKMNYRDGCSVIERGKAETIGGKQDYWYRITFYDGKASKNGWIFGAFTSLRQDGRKKIVMVFDGCSADSNNFSHKIFRDQTGKKWDFSDTGHDFGDYLLCTAGVNSEGKPAEVGAKEFTGKKFEVVLNDLTITPSCMWEPEVCRKYMKSYTRPSVIFLRMIK